MFAHTSHLPNHLDGRTNGSFAKEWTYWVVQVYTGSNFTPELSQLNQDFHPRYTLGLILPRNCHNLTRISTPGICNGKANFLANAYANVPIAITVEGISTI